MDPPLTLHFSKANRVNRHQEFFKPEVLCILTFSPPHLGKRPMKRALIFTVKEHKAFDDQRKGHIH